MSARFRVGQACLSVSGAMIMGILLVQSKAVLASDVPTEPLEILRVPGPEYERLGDAPTDPVEPISGILPWITDRYVSVDVGRVGYKSTNPVTQVGDDRRTREGRLGVGGRIVQDWAIDIGLHYDRSRGDGTNGQAGGTINEYRTSGYGFDALISYDPVPFLTVGANYSRSRTKGEYVQQGNQTESHGTSQSYGFFSTVYYPPTQNLLLDATLAYGKAWNEQNYPGSAIEEQESWSRVVSLTVAGNYLFTPKLGVRAGLTRYELVNESVFGTPGNQEPGLDDSWNAYFVGAQYEFVEDTSVRVAISDWFSNDLADRRSVNFGIVYGF